MSPNYFDKFLMLSATAFLISGLVFIKKAREDSVIEKSIANQKSLPQPPPNLQHQDITSRAITQSSTIPSRRPASPSGKIKLIQARLLKVESCYSRPGQCGFPQTDPKSEFFAIGQKIREDLNTLFHMAIEKKVKNNSLTNIAKHFLKVPDGHVKEAALHLLSTQEKSESNMEAILQEIINYHDARLIEHAMLELQYYIDDPDRGHLIHAALSNAIKGGSVLVSQEVTHHIRPFINDQSVVLYSQTMKALSLGGLSRKRIENAINDFKLSQKSA